MLSTASRKPNTAAKPSGTPSSSTSPCGACRFLRRKCAAGCVFAAHFGSEQGSSPARFAAVHKVFGARNVSKLLKLVPPDHRHEAVVTVCYEAQARVYDPVLGCVGTIITLHQQIARLQTELSIVQSQLINSRLVAAAAAATTMTGVFRYSETQQQLMAIQPSYSTSSVSNNFYLRSFPSSVFDVCDSQSFELCSLHRESCAQDDGEKVEDSIVQNPEGFSSQIFQPE